MRGNSAHERWDGFWAEEDEKYYTRCTRDDGSEQWFRFGVEAPVGKPVREARVLPLRRTTADGRRILERELPRMVVFGCFRADRTILVGASRRRGARSSSSQSGGAR